MGKQEMVRSDRSTSIWSDLKYLLKGFVLISNVLPVFVGSWLAIFLTDATFATHGWMLILALLGGTFVMAGALVLNNWYEVDLDKMMLRTQRRPTVTGSMSMRKVLWLGVIFSVIGFIIMFFTTVEAFIYAFIGWFTYVVLYTFWSKRKYTLNTVIGSLSGAVTPLIGWGAIAPSNHTVPIVLFFILFIWQIPHTFAIAMRRSEEYRAAKVPMLPVVAGFDVAKRQIFIFVACLLPLPFLLYSLGLPFVIAATLLNIGWLVIAIRIFFPERAADIERAADHAIGDDVRIADHLNVRDIKWAHAIFYYSLFYLTVLFALMVFVVTFQ